ncbi:MAG: hypothetical protein JSR66_32820 [Proteobacteria bacterium]|nr:hypothetical protein [Pseudomonadota bacterium]
MARTRSRSPQVDNVIEPTTLRPQPGPKDREDRRDHPSRESAIRAEGGVAATPSNNRGPEAPPLSGGARDTTSVPNSVRDRFLQIKEKWYFENGDLAFHDMGTKLSTRSENQEVLRSFVAIAATRSWEDINIVEGTKEFRRAIWYEASLQGIPVRGYTPTALDEARLVQTMARRRQAERETQSQASPDPEATAPRATRARNRDGTRDRTTVENPEAASSQQPKRVLYGTLVSHGPENFEFNPQEDMSYYVKLRTDRGKEIVLWGKDLERALRESKSQPKPGDSVGVSHAGREPVTVPKKERDDKGRVLREYEIKTHRNEWLIETREFFREREQLADVVRDRAVDAKRAVDLNPALAGTYVALRGAELYAQKNFQDPHEQQRFVEAIRRSMARDIKRGAPLYTPALRDRDIERGAQRERNVPEMSPLR